MTENTQDQNPPVKPTAPASDGSTAQSSSGSPAPSIGLKVKFVGTRSEGGEDVKQEEAPTWLRSGYEIFDDLPASDIQLSGFNYARAQELCRAFPGLYKLVTEKGE